MPKALPIVSRHRPLICPWAAGESEPTSGVVWNANRGAITLRVTVHGRPAHVGLMHQGRTAFEDAIRVVAGLQRLARRVGRRRTRFNLAPAAAKRCRWCRS